MSCLLDREILPCFWDFWKRSREIQQQQIIQLYIKTKWPKNGSDFNRENQRGRQPRDRNRIDNQGAHKKRVPDTERLSINGLKLRIPKKYLENQVSEDKEFHANLPKLEMFPTQDHNVENATWGSLPFCLFKEIINKTYDEICHYRRNIFKIPSGKIGKMFIEELTFWL